MRKQPIHVKSYERSRHGRATFGGRVCAHNKSGRAISDETPANLLNLLRNPSTSWSYSPAKLSEYADQHGEEIARAAGWPTDPDTPYLNRYTARKEKLSWLLNSGGWGEVLAKWTPKDLYDESEYLSPHIFTQTQKGQLTLSGRADVTEEGLYRFLNSKGISTAQADALVKEKKEEYGGLLTKAAALYFVAKEHGLVAGEKSSQMILSGRMARPWGGKPKTREELLEIMNRELAQAEKHRQEETAMRERIEKLQSRLRKMSDKHGEGSAAKQSIKFIEKFGATRAGYEPISGATIIEKEGKRYRPVYKRKPSGGYEEEVVLEEVKD